jgi:hypothetical protein
MPLPDNFDLSRDSPNPGMCRRCKQGGLKPTLAYKMLTTGIVEHLYICRVCGWGHCYRYDPADTAHYLLCNYVTPGNKFAAWKVPVVSNKRKG